MFGIGDKTLYFQLLPERLMIKIILFDEVKVQKAFK
jgi:hypothetical protein